jgi:hypothetical protein
VSSTKSPNVVLGRVEPRVFTPPRRDLSREEASWGYDFIDFCEYIGWELDEWQKWLAIHIGELNKDGSARFRKAIILVARQNGKTVFTRLLILYWMWVDRVELIIATSTNLNMAKKSWRQVVKLAESTPALAKGLEPKHTYMAVGDEDFWNIYDSHYTFAAPNSRAGRGDTVDRCILDELRQHRNRDTWDAIIPAMNAKRDALAVCISNEGDLTAVVLHEEYDAALEYVETGEGDPTTFLAAWSSPQGSKPTDLEALAQANPNLNRKRATGNYLRQEQLLGEAIKAEKLGGESLARFKIEYMCQRIDLLDSAIDPSAWRNCGVDDDEFPDLANYRRRLALCYDVSLDGTHATLMAAVRIDDEIYVEVVKTWAGYGATRALRAELPDWVTRLRPRALGWFPNGPAAAVAASLKDRSTNNQWPPRGILVEELNTETPAVCMGLAEQVLSDEIRHPCDPLLNAHVKQTQKLPRGDQWVFTRKGSQPVDATYALAGAVHLVRTMPAPLAKLEIATARTD